MNRNDVRTLSPSIPSRITGIFYLAASLLLGVGAHGESIGVPAPEQMIRDAEVVVVAKMLDHQSDPFVLKVIECIKGPFAAGSTVRMRSPYSSQAFNPAHFEKTMGAQPFLFVGASREGAVMPAYGMSSGWPAGVGLSKTLEQCVNFAKSVAGTNGASRIDPSFNEEWNAKPRGLALMAQTAEGRAYLLRIGVDQARIDQLQQEGAQAQKNLERIRAKNAASDGRAR